MAHGSSEVQLLLKFGRLAWLRGWLLLAIQVAATVAGVVALQVLPRRYTSSTTIRVERQQMANPLVPQQRGDGTSEIEDRVRSLREEILSRDYFEKVVSRLGLADPRATQLQREGLVQRMIANTEIKTKQREADTFQITYVGDDPQSVRDVTNILAGIFIEESLASKSGDADSAVDFLQGQLEIYRKRLEESEAALRRYEEQHVDQVPATRAAQLARIEQAQASLAEVQSSLRQARMQRDLARQRLMGGAGAPGGEVQVPNPLRERIDEREAQLRRLLLDFSESYPDVVALRAEIAQMKSELQAHPTVPAAAVEPSGGTMQDAIALGQLEQLEVEVTSLTAREEQLLREIARAEKRVRGIPEVEQELARLKRDYDVNDDIYNSFLRRLEEARVSQELENSNQGEVFRILQAAQLPLTPFWPKREQLLFGGLGAGLAVNVALLLLLAQLDTSFQSAEEVKAALGVKVLAGIRRHRSARDAAVVRARAVALGAAAGAYLAVVAAVLFWPQVASLLRGAGR